MSVFGLTFSPPKLSYCVVHARGSSSLRRSVLPSNCNGVSREKVCFVSHVDSYCRKYLTSTVHGHSIRGPGMMKSIVCAAFGDMADDSTDVFPRIDIKDPYKRLGFSREASEEEIQAARNFLINKYGGHKPSVDAIESAHDRIIMQSFHDRKNPKINLKKKVREVTQSRVVKAVTSRFETPAVNFVIKTAITFIVLGVLTVLFPTEEGPTLQVAISLIASIYFLHSRLKSRIRAFLYGILQEFAVNNKVMVMSHSKAARKLHAWRKDFDKVLKRIASITYEFDSPWDPGINSVFDKDDAPRSTLCALIELLSSTADTSWRPAPLPPPWSRRVVLMLLSRPPPWPD